MSTVPTPPFTTWCDLVSRTETALAASVVVVLEAGALDDEDSEETAGDGGVVAALVVADAGADDVTAVDALADAEALGFGEPPPQAPTRVAVSAIQKTQRLTTRRSDDVRTGLLSMVAIHPKTLTMPARLRGGRGTEAGGTVG
jgi:hypothetical protein